MINQKEPSLPLAATSGVRWNKLIIVLERINLNNLVITTTSETSWQA